MRNEMNDDNRILRKTTISNTTSGDTTARKSKSQFCYKAAVCVLAAFLVMPFLSGCGMDDFLGTPIGKKIMEVMIGKDWEESEDTDEDDNDFPVIEFPVYGKGDGKPGEGSDASKDGTATGNEADKKNGNEVGGASGNGLEKGNENKSEEVVSQNSAEENSQGDTNSETAPEETMTDEEMQFNCEGMYRYGYSKLADADRAVYRDIYNALTNHNKGLKLSSKNEDQIDRVFQVVMGDHPEIYYVTGYTINKYLLGGKIVSIEFSGKYTHSKEKCDEYDPRIKNYKNQCLADLPDTGDDYDKVKYIYDYIVDRTDYSLQAQENQNILSVFLYGKSVCNGYAKAAQYLLNEAGIPCLIVSGTVKNGESHAWNIVYVNGKWYAMDVTWGDASYMTNAPEMEPGINYDYLCVNDEINNRTHRASSKIELPKCDSLDAYYYVREGTYITDIDEEQLTTLFQNGYETGKDRITLKCDSYANYEKLQKYLIDEEHIFTLMKASGNKINYARLPDSWGMIFYL